MLAPVLARLDSIAGVAPARVDSSGRYFWLAPGGGVNPVVATSRAREILGEGSRVLPPGEAEVQLAARARGDPWLTATEVMTLSFVEGRLLSVRISTAAAREIGLGPSGTETVAEAVRVELFSALGRVHAEGGRQSSAWIDAAWPAIAAAAAARCAAVLAPGQLRRLSECLPGLLRS